MNDRGILLQKNEEIEKFAVEFFTDQFIESNDNQNFSMLGYIASPQKKMRKCSNYQTGRGEKCSFLT